MSARISKMYKKSGGTDYKHRCETCEYLMRYQLKRRTNCKCLLFGDDGTHESDWKEDWTACHFYQESDLLRKKRDEKEDNEQLEGQMDIFDYGL